MSDKELYFLEEKYYLPSELREFVGYLREFEKIHEEIMQLLTKQMKQKSYSGGADEDFVYFKKPLTNVGQRIIAKLSENGIYNVTINDLVYRNEGYIQLHNICKDTMQGMIDILLKAMSDWQNGYEHAYSSAASNISGSGVSIWTNSLSSALLYSAMEASTLKKQSDKAAKEYSIAMKSLNTRIDNAQERQERELLVNKYYPGVAQALSIFVSKLMEYYITMLDEKGVFDYSKVKQYDLRRSSELLKNISLVKDKKSILKEAFICCPYNPDVYQAVLENSLSDIKTFESAKYFMQDEVLLTSIKDYCKQNSSNYDSIVIPIKIWAMYTHKSERSIWLLLYRNKIQLIQRKYKAIQSAIMNRNDLILWIKDNITQKATDLCDMQETSLSYKISKSVSQNAVSNKQLLLFCQLGLLDIKEISLPNSAAKTIAETNAEYTDMLLKLINEYISELRLHIQKCKTKAVAIKREYDEKLAIYNNELENMSQKLSSLKEQRHNLGMFAFGKKKAKDIEIRRLKEEIEKYKDENSPQYLIESYDKHLQEANVFA